MSAFPTIKLTYFHFAARAEPARLAFYIGGVPFEDKRMSFEEFGAVKESLPLGQLPTLEVDGEVLTQSYAITRYAGRLSGLYPTSAPFVALKIDEVLHAMTEMEQKMGPAFREKDADKKKALREELAAVTLPRYAGLIENRLEKMQQLLAFQSGAVFVHELVIYGWVKSLRAGYIDHIPTTVLDGYKLLNETFEKIDAHPKVREWYSLHHTTPKLKLTYAALPGRAEPIRLAFFLGGVDFEDERLSFEELARLFPTLPFNQIPVLEVDGEVVAQSGAILRYAGSLSGLYPTTDLLAAYRVDELIALVDDMFNFPDWTCATREQDPMKQLELRTGMANDIVPKTLRFLEKRVAQFKGPYATGTNFTVADLVVYALLVTLKKGVRGIPVTITDSYESLQRVFNQVKGHPKVAEWNAAHQ